MAELEQILQRKLSEFTDCKRQLVEMENRIESLVAADEANNKQQLNDIERLTKTCANLEKFNAESVNKSNTRIHELEVSVELYKRFFCSQSSLFLFFLIFVLNNFNKFKVKLKNKKSQFPQTKVSSIIRWL